VEQLLTPPPSSASSSPPDEEDSLEELFVAPPLFSPLPAPEPPTPPPPTPDVLEELFVLLELEEPPHSLAHSVEQALQPQSTIAM
jgi:hypothetical protein